MILKDNHDVRDLDFSTFDQGMLVWIRDGAPKLCECRGRLELSIGYCVFLTWSLTYCDTGSCLGPRIHSKAPGSKKFLAAERFGWFGLIRLAFARDSTDARLNTCRSVVSQKQKAQGTDSFMPDLEFVSESFLTCCSLDSHRDYRIRI